MVHSRKDRKNNGIRHWHWQNLSHPV